MWNYHIPSNSTTRYIPKGSDNMCPKENLYMNVYSNIIHYNQKIETTRCPSICNKNECNKLENSERDRKWQNTLPTSLRNLEAGQEARVGPNMECLEWTGSRLPGEISITSDMQMTPQICRWRHPNGRKWRGSKESLNEGEKSRVKKLA